MTHEDRTIVAEVPQSEAHLRATYAAVLSRSPLRVFPYYLWAGCVYALVFFVALLSPRNLFTLANAELLVLIVVLFLMSLLWVPGWRARRDHADGVGLEGAAAWTFTRERLECRAGERAGFELQWSAVHAVEKLPGGLLLFNHPRIAHWIPKSAFAAAADYDQAGAWAAFGAPRYRERRQWRIAEWITALALAPLAAPLALYFAMVVRSEGRLLESHLTLLHALAVGLPFAYAGGWLLGAPAWWIAARFTRRAAAFVAAGAAVGMIVGVALVRGLGFGGFGGTIAEWAAGFALAGLVHWFIVARKPGSDPSFL
jgi:hypothetical protein